MKTPKNKYSGKCRVGTALVVAAALVAVLFLGCKQEADPVPTYTVTFGAKGGSTVPAQTVESGKTATRPADPDRTGYTFNGWFKDNTRYDFSTAVTGDLSLTAKWVTAHGIVKVPGGEIAGAAYTNNHKGVFPEGRTVTLGDFLMSDHEVTQAEYEAVMGSNPSSFSSNPFSREKQENRPVEMVSWYDAIVYCNKRSMDEGLTPCYTINGSTDPADWGTVPTFSDETWDAVTCNWDADGYRLPTEAEWEYAARGGNPAGEQWDWTFSGANTAEGATYSSSQNAGLDSVGWYWFNNDGGTTKEGEPTFQGTHEVKKRAKNALGLHDMSGNVKEWCWDRYVLGSGDITADTLATGAVSGSSRVRRGGAWGSYASDCTVSFRDNYSPYSRDYSNGFRVVRSAAVPTQP